MLTAFHSLLPENIQWVLSYRQLLVKYVHKVLVNRLGGLSLPRKSVVRLTDRPDMTLNVYRGRKTTKQTNKQTGKIGIFSVLNSSLVL